MGDDEIAAIVGVVADCDSGVSCGGSATKRGACGEQSACTSDDGSCGVSECIAGCGGSCDGMGAGAGTGTGGVSLPTNCCCRGPVADTVVVAVAVESLVVVVIVDRSPGSCGNGD